MRYDLMMESRGYVYTCILLSMCFGVDSSAQSLRRYHQTPPSLLCKQQDQLCLSFKPSVSFWSATKESPPSSA